MTAIWKIYHPWQGQELRTRHEQKNSVDDEHNNLITTMPTFIKLARPNLLTSSQQEY
jgi:hypothetical protein